MTTTIEKLDSFDKLLEKHELNKFLRITDQIKRFINNCQKTKRGSQLKLTKYSIKEISMKGEQQSVRYRKV